MRRVATFRNNKRSAQCQCVTLKKFNLFSKLNSTLNLMLHVWKFVVLIVKDFWMFDQAATCTGSNNREKKPEKHTKATTGRSHWMYCDRRTIGEHCRTIGNVYMSSAFIDKLKCLFVACVRSCYVCFEMKGSGWTIDRLRTVGIWVRYCYTLWSWVGTDR